jgi:hypothetical protein
LLFELGFSLSPPELRGVNRIKTVLSDPRQVMNKDLSSPQTRVRNRIRSACRRRGAAVTEMAVFLPLIVTCVFGTLEICSGIYLKQTLTISAYEGIRMATFRGSEPGEAEPIARRILSDRHISGGSVSFSPASPESALPGTIVTISVSAPTSSNCYRFAFLPSQTYVVQTTMVKE